MSLSKVPHVVESWVSSQGRTWVRLSDGSEWYWRGGSRWSSPPGCNATGGWANQDDPPWLPKPKRNGYGKSNPKGKEKGPKTAPLAIGSGDPRVSTPNYPEGTMRAHAEHASGRKVKRVIEWIFIVEYGDGDKGEFFG
ncbi:hypothetical protein [Parafrankia sp. EUN1f]|uniref:hypothetical protein n=1 Tax=Parafrankia sp. EUN1f TaxID=102897 RepID=UPI0001C4556A|nr:hypothetical protein [Parafrankia sp. EUN1f]EFC86449.1 hypothetical protein FrEUN1fDRAFT_0344 [Parafrankia sp. EUN1f]